MVPVWFTVLSCLALAAGLLSALWMTREMVWQPPHMRIMAAVWPLCALFAGPLLILFYRRHGKGHGTGSFATAVAKGALHCGAGCSLGDLIAESTIALRPAVLLPFGYPGLWPDPIFAGWILDFLLAFGLGIVFQYYAIVPMRKLSPGRGIVAALKADALSLIAWQVGMYGAMALARFWLFDQVLQAPLEATRPSFWFMMQLAMLAGFATAYPMNWALIRAGIKEQM